MSILAIANRKGGVGKSTIATMIAYGLAVWGKRRVLLIDLDAQCNSSLILFGGQNWSLARNKSQTIADYFDARFDHKGNDYHEYLFSEVGDVAINVKTSPPQLSLVPGSVDLEDIEHELLHRLAGTTNNLYQAEQGVIGRLSMMLRDLQGNHPVLIFDCPPGLSFATQAALKIADRVIVPFRPDYVSAFAVDRISRMIEGKPNLLAVNEIPRGDRRYVALANFVSSDITVKERIEEIEDYHPLMETRIPQNNQIADSFNWRRDRVPIEEKFGKAGVKVARAVFEEVSAML